MRTARACSKRSVPNLPARHLRGSGSSKPALHPACSASIPGEEEEDAPLPHLSRVRRCPPAAGGKAMRSALLSFALPPARLHLAFHPPFALLRI